ncbi:HlyD family secretion protein [Lichenicoccus roseus]|uniref:HlyD family efflux transporter periplasmic adaptor subunit n=1 Tax=Lichenicoccus roseus TaxID=2683649 RepID=A0A5R9JAW6_9PROT|nr:HlyD family efflux transporter periplasmic adaptor subunit [Lichenicoccus roseus]TLU74139.1 HlyD family efflux transporter periplasmic adaptor subunit [Lichenicoccus roseus]
MQSLFRSEALEARRDAWLGRVQVAQPIPVRVATVMTAVFLAATVLFVCTGTYTRRVHAGGRMLPPTGLITIQSPAAGILARQYAVEGRHVSRGQPLFVLDMEANSASGPTQLHILADLASQRRLLQQQRSLRETAAVIDKQSLALALQNLAEQRRQLTLQIDLDNQTMPAVQRSLARLQDAAQQHIATDAQLQSQIYTYTELLSTHAQFLQSSLEVDGRLAETAARYRRFDSDLARELADLDRQIAGLDQQVAENEAKRTISILAPDDGTLTAIRAHVGQHVEAGSTLLTLLPRSQTLEADLYVTSAAIGFIREGAPVLLRYAAFPYQRFGLYRGRVTQITRAPMTIEGGATVGGAVEGGQAGDGGEYYRIVVMPDLPYVLTYGQHRPLEAGMQVEANIALDRRRLYQWLFDPLISLERSVGAVAGRGPAP